MKIKAVYPNFLVWFFLILLIACFFASTGKVSAAFDGESISDFSVKVEVLKNSTLLLEEKIVYNFSSNYRHGIYRDIPSKDVLIRVKKVLDNTSEPWQYQVSRLRDYLRIKIGDPDKTIMGTHTYHIFYEMDFAVGYFQEHDELYWNVTGNEWEVPIESASIKVNLPEDVGKESLRLACFTGSYGKSESDCSWKVISPSQVYFQSEKALQPQEGLTIVLGWPKGIVPGPSLAKRISRFVQKWIFFVIPLLLFIFLFRLWLKKGRDARVKKTIIAQYEAPDNLRPAEVAIIKDQKVIPRAVSATIVDLARRGYLKIKETEKKEILFKKKDWQLIKMRDFESDESLKRYENYLLWSIFPSKTQEKRLVSSMENKFYDKFAQLKKKISRRVTFDDYFVENPDKVRKRFLLPSIGAFVLGIFSLATWRVGVPLLICAALLLFFSFFMPKKTKKGAEALWHILGLEEYIKTAERYRVKFQEQENIFEKILPYAIVFNLADKWAKAFEGIYTKQPSWYESARPGVFSTAVFVGALNSSLSGITSSMASKPGGRSGGSGFAGGFAGGGAGGGGGGSW